MIITHDIHLILWILLILQVIAIIIQTIILETWRDTAKDIKDIRSGYICAADHDEAACNVTTVTIGAWVARDANEVIMLYNFRPWKREAEGVWKCKAVKGEEGFSSFIPLQKESFPSIKWEDPEPTQVSMTINIDQQF